MVLMREGQFERVEHGATELAKKTDSPFRKRRILTLAAAARIELGLDVGTAEYGLRQLDPAYSGWVRARERQVAHDPRAACDIYREVLRRGEIPANSMLSFLGDYAIACVEVGNLERAVWARRRMFRLMRPRWYHR